RIAIGQGEDPYGADDARPWIAALGDGIASSTVRTLAVKYGAHNFHIAKTADAGKSWHTQMIGDVGQSGPLEVDKTKRTVSDGRQAILLYQIYYTGSTLKVMRIADVTDTNSTPAYIVDNLTIPTPGSI